LLESGKVEFVGGSEIEILHGGQKALHHISHEAVADEIGPTANERIQAHSGSSKSGIKIKLVKCEAELNTHAGSDAGLQEELAGEGFIRLRLTVETMEFLAGVTKSVGGALCSSRELTPRRSRSGLAGKNDCNRKRGDEVKREGGSQARGSAAGGKERTKIKFAKVVF